MSKGGSTQTTTTVEKSEPWAGIQPYLLSIAGESGQLAPRTYYPGNTVAPFSNQTRAYMDRGTQRALNDPVYTATEASVLGTLAGGSSNPFAKYLDPYASGQRLGSNPAHQYLGRQARGEFLGPNPYADATFGHAARNMRNQVDAAFARSGRDVNSNAYASELTDRLGQLSDQYYFDNYRNERGAMDSAGSQLGSIYSGEVGDQINAAGQIGGSVMDAQRFMPTLGSMYWGNLDRLNQIGELEEGMSQAQIEDAMTRWNFAQNEPYQYLADKSNIIQGIGGDYSTRSETSTAPAPRRSIGSTILGGLSTAAGLFSSKSFKHDFGPAYRILAA